MQLFNPGSQNTWLLDEKEVLKKVPEQLDNVNYEDKMVLNVQDTIIHIQLYNKSKKVRPQSQVYYYWYKNQQIKKHTATFVRRRIH